MQKRTEDKIHEEVWILSLIPFQVDADPSICGLGAELDMLKFPFFAISFGVFGPEGISSTRDFMNSRSACHFNYIKVTEFHTCQALGEGIKLS